jgi:hypothetical protein
MRGAFAIVTTAGWDAVDGSGVRAWNRAPGNRGELRPADDHAATGRPKSRYPGASPCAGSSAKPCRPEAGERRPTRRQSLSEGRQGRCISLPSMVDYSGSPTRGLRRTKPLKPLRAERRAFPGVTVVTTLVCFSTIAHEAAGASAPGVPRALVSKEGGTFTQNPGATRRGNEEVCLVVDTMIAAPSRGLFDT